MWSPLETLYHAFIVLYVLSRWIQSILSEKRAREPPAPTQIPAPRHIPTLSNKISFQNSTVEPYDPSIEVSERLWSILDGDNATEIVYTPDKRPLGMTAMLATRYLRNKPNRDHLKMVQELQKETKKIASNCLAEIRGEKGHLFGPDTVRNLQLTNNLDEELGYEVDDKDCTGILRNFEDEILPTGDHKYTLTIQPPEPAGGLPVINLSLTSRKWFAGSCGIKFKQHVDM
ncbi:hypothetical protein AG0111_0g12086 [Alternaria gaisen]|uniref:Uncharacterized protein n=1 Tax=Alternaria gaisen TaxID=167740 RepID=A0ACB6F5I9_9PLEO|nr:hypothetical protein AG0111_0g12086 [Alternaria gaisen]